MASKTTLFCDRCGKEFQRKGFTHSVKIPRQISLLAYDFQRCFFEKEYDLCEDCYKDFFKYLDGGKKDGK